MPDVAELHEEIVDLMAAGASLDEVEEQVIEGSSLPPEQRSALWLYAWGPRTQHGAERMLRAELPVGD